jgi:hypothetical protein
MVGLMGVSMIVAAYRKDWRKPILIYSGFEKSSMVYLVATNISHPFSQGFWVGAGMDATVVLYTVVYFAVYGLTSFHERTFKLRHCWIARATVLFAAVGKSGCGIGPTNALRCIVAFSKQVNIPSVRIDWINPNASMNSRNYGARAGPICGARTGLAIP